MKFILVLLIVACIGCQKKDCSTKKVPTATADQFELIGEAINEPDYDIWGSSPIRDTDGKVHIFCARWKAEIPFRKAWRYDSEIAHYVGDNAEGPFRFVEVVASPQTINGRWNKAGFHNPNIRKIGNKYVLVYIANDGAEQHGPTQFIGMMIADNLNGPWQQIPNNNTPILQTPDEKEKWCFQSGCGVTNPSILAHPNGKFYLYFKAMTGARPHGKVKMGVAIADKIEGPYEIEPKPITATNKMIEDGYAFVWRNHICLLTTDNHGIIEPGGGLLWKSKDGLLFEVEPMSGFHHFGNFHLNKNIPKTAKAHYGSAVKFERPQLLFKEDGEIDYLYCPSGVAIDGSNGTNSYVLKYKE